jgi:ABC-type arginine/histidine transport system permease subunit
MLYITISIPLLLLCLMTICYWPSTAWLSVIIGLFANVILAIVVKKCVMVKLASNLFCSTFTGTPLSLSIAYYYYSLVSHLVFSITYLIVSKRS